MEFILNHLEGFVSAIALLVSILGAIIGRYLTKRDMLKEQKANLDKEIYYNFFDLIFTFFELCSPEFADDILDSVFDKYQYADETLKSRIDKAYIQISKRKDKLRLHIVKIETYVTSDMEEKNDVLKKVTSIYDHYLNLLSSYEKELRNGFMEDNEEDINDDLLRNLKNTYDGEYNKTVEWIKAYMIRRKTNLIG